MAKTTANKPRSLRLKIDLEKKISDFMKRENRQFGNAIDTLLRIAFEALEKKR